MSRLLRSSRARWTAAGVLGLTVALAAFVLPVFGTSGPDADRLRLTDTTEAFFYGDTSPTASGVTLQQVKVGTKGCEIDPLNGPLVVLSSAGGGGVKDPGLFAHSIGVKSGGSNGTPCSQTDGNEKLVVRSNGNSWYKLELDVEAKGNARIYAQLRTGGAGGALVDTYQLLTGSSIAAYNASNDPDETPSPGFPYEAHADSSNLVEACANPSDSGPDSGPNDNCRWYITSDAPFDTVVLYTSVGSVSLEGGGDFVSLTGFGAGNYDSLFYRAAAPTAVDDSYSTNEDTPLTVPGPGVLGNDSDIFNSPLSASVVSTTSNGALVLNGNGGFTYTPAADWNGTDTFTYKASAGGQDSNVATVTITVNPINDPPVAKGTPLSATEDTPESYSGSDLATDVDGDALIIAAASASGSVVVNPDGTITYNAVGNSCAPDTLSFTVSDGNGGTVSGTVTINVTCVNDAPVADDDSYETNERDSSGLVTLNVAAPGVLDGDTDADGDTLTASNATATAQGGTVVLNANGSFDYTPASSYPWDDDEFSYNDTWDYTASDPSTASDVGTVTVTVHRVICSGETVSDQDGNISGSFTLISEIDECKRYEVDADSVTETITFTPGVGEQAFFRGALSFTPQTLNAGGTFSLGLDYDPDNEGPLEPKVVQVCLDPVFDGDGLIVSATLPSGETWCFAGEVSQASATVPGEIVTVFQVYGTEDPKFSFR